MALPDSLKRLDERLLPHSGRAPTERSKIQFLIAMQLVSGAALIGAIWSRTFLIVAFSSVVPTLSELVRRLPPKGEET